MKLLIWLGLASVLAMNIGCSEPYKPWGIPTKDLPRRTENPQPKPQKPEAPKETPIPWDQFVGHYRLARFDGELIAPSFWNKIYYETTPSYIDANTGAPLKILMIPLYSEVSYGDADYTYFGVVEGHGNGTVEYQGGNAYYTYKYAAWIKASQQGQAFPIEFNITIEQDRALLKINYELIWSGKAERHSFELIRVWE